MAVSNEKKVGLLVLGALLVAGVFAWLIGVDNPFKRGLEFYVTYEFAGGIEVGSSVRVAGIKVGKVSEIDFFVSDPGAKTGANPISLKEPGSAERAKAQTPVRLKLAIDPRAAVGIRQDSRFYINLAGIIGDRYIEITPGDPSLPGVKEGDTLAGVDPPRIDQLLSQSFDLAGRVIDLVEKNKGDLTRTINTLYKLSENVNRTVIALDKSNFLKSDLSQLVMNLIEITRQMRVVTDRIDTPEGRQTLTLMHTLLQRLEPLDREAIRSFLQDEGIRARIF